MELDRAGFGEPHAGGPSVKRPEWRRWLWLVTSVLGALLVVRYLGDSLLLIALALLLAAAFAPIVGWLQSHRVPRVIGTLVCLLVLTAVMAVTIGLLVPTLLRQAAQLAEMLPAIGRRLAELEARWSSWNDQYVFLPRFSDLIEGIRRQISAVGLGTLAVGRMLLRVTIEVLMVLLMVFFFLKDGRALLNQALSPVSEARRARLLPLFDRLGHRLGRFVLGRLLVMVAVGLLTGVGLAIIGTPYAVFLGVLAGLFDIIPYFGPFIAAVPGLLVASNDSLAMVFGVLAIYIGVQQLESLVISPLLIGKAVGLHPLWVVVAVIVGAEIMGVMGMILAVPLASTVQIVVHELRARGRTDESPPDTRQG